MKLVITCKLFNLFTIIYYSPLKIAKLMNDSAVLIHRGTCSFSEKLKYCARTGASLVILIDYKIVCFLLLFCN